MNLIFIFYPKVSLSSSAPKLNCKFGEILPIHRISCSQNFRTHGQT